MTESETGPGLEKGPQGLRRGRGARERILSASAQLFRDQGINSTGMDQLCAVAGVSKRTLYQHFPSKDELIAEHLRRFDPNVLPEVFNRADLTPRERLLTPFDIQSPLCPFIAAAVEISDPGHPARVYARDYKQALAARFIEAARAARPAARRCRRAQPGARRLGLHHGRGGRCRPRRHRHPHGSCAARRC